MGTTEDGDKKSSISSTVQLLKLKSPHSSNFTDYGKKFIAPSLN